MSSAKVTKKFSAADLMISRRLNDLSNGFSRSMKTKLIGVVYLPGVLSGNLFVLAGDWRWIEGWLFSDHLPPDVLLDPPLSLFLRSGTAQRSASARHSSKARRAGTKSSSHSSLLTSLSGLRSCRSTLDDFTGARRFPCGSKQSEHVCWLSRSSSCLRRSGKTPSRLPS